MVVNFEAQISDSLLLVFPYTCDDLCLAIQHETNHYKTSQGAAKHPAIKTTKQGYGAKIEFNKTLNF